MCTRKRCVVCLLLTAVLLAGTILPAFAYDDVPSAAWYAGTVREITERGWMNGLGNGSFAPESSMTRAMFVTVLHRAVGTPDGGAIPFTDVPDGAYCRGLGRGDRRRAGRVRNPVRPGPLRHPGAGGRHALPLSLSQSREWLPCGL